ncbi:MAG: class I SAM-dependent methyltransferase [Bacillota bacterium]
MKVRESGMPEEAYWESFFDTDLILSKLRFDNKIINAAEFGSGYGTFSIPASKIIKGVLYAFDIDPLMTERLRLRAEKENIKNINIIQADFVNNHASLEESSVDYVMLFNILHAEDPYALLKEARRILKENAKAGIIHWQYSESTPRGPSMDIRPKPEQCIKWLKETGFEVLDGIIDLPPYHYGLVGSKIEKSIARMNK